jgi:hypothetical protein
VGSLVAAATVMAAFVLIGAAPASASGPRAGLSIEPASGQLTVELVADSGGFPNPVVSYKWRFGDGVVVKTAVPNVVHTYPAAATFKPSVTETDSAGHKASVTATVALFNCPPSDQCTATLNNVGTVQSLQVSGPIAAAAVAGVNLDVGPFKIKHCETSIEPAVAFTDSQFTGNLVATVTYTTSQPSSVGTTCFASTVPFANSVGALVTSGALPPCMSMPAPPCVESIGQQGSLVTKVLLVPPGDPKVGVP